MITVAQIMEAKSYPALVEELRRNKEVDEELLECSEKYRNDLIIGLAVIAAGTCVTGSEIAKLGMVAMFQVGYDIDLYAFGTLIGEMQAYGTREAAKQERYQTLASKVIKYG